MGAAETMEENMGLLTYLELTRCTKPQLWESVLPDAARAARLGRGITGAGERGAEFPAHPTVPGAARLHAVLSGSAGWATSSRTRCGSTPSLAEFVFSAGPGFAMVFGAVRRGPTQPPQGSGSRPPSEGRSSWP